jgi:non-ribosomal peptide synthetase component E (peptide arylation enzyme)
MKSLHDFLVNATSQYPDNVAIVDPDVGSLTYRELGQLSDRVRDRLYSLGVRRERGWELLFAKIANTVAVIYRFSSLGAAVG